MIKEKNVNIVVGGGGPASLCLLLNAVRKNKIETLLKGGGIVILEADNSLGPGTLEKYIIDSNTKAIGFLRTLFKDPEALMDVYNKYIILLIIILIIIII